MTQLLRFPRAAERDPTIDVWMRDHAGPLGTLAHHWFEFTAHVNVGFFRGAEIADPDGLLEGTGRFMRHVKLRPGYQVDDAALTKLIATAYTDMQRRVSSG